MPRRRPPVEIFTFPVPDNLTGAAARCPACSGVSKPYGCVGHMLVFKLDFLRRSQVGEIMRNQLDQHGVLGLAKGVLGLRGLMEDTALAARYPDDLDAQTLYAESLMIPNRIDI